MSLDIHDNSTPKNRTNTSIRNTRIINSTPQVSTDLSNQHIDSATANHDPITTDPADKNDANVDPISGQPGAHPLGTGVGAAGIGSVATVVGSVVGGPIGAVVGAVVGSVVGGLAGKSTAEQINPTFEDNHWRENYSSRPYVEQGATYEEYQYAYRVGYEGYDRYGNTGRNYSDVEPDLQSYYETTNQQGKLTWDKAKHAVRDAWDRAAASSHH